MFVIVWEGSFKVSRTLEQAASESTPNTSRMAVVAQSRLYTVVRMYTMEGSCSCGMVMVGLGFDMMGGRGDVREEITSRSVEVDDK